ncbi:hypothetical protein [Chondrinema litorale]|uniref:hypothetical protein n=1 Tax=Chondrinema litorale TaxID=2994555 RepID=UPI00254399AC|nr:hypothetical protein [Chondrinema litorale]UZR95054.1 hypothetical protein OQ292_04395 [Chondrinema litorale]
MKRLSILITVMLMGISFYGFSQRDGRGKNMTAEDRATMQTTHMKTELSLNEATVTSVQEINLKYAQKQKEVFDSDLQGTDRRSKMDAIRTERMAELKTVLSDEQYVKMEEIQAQMQGRARGNRRNSSTNN